MSEQRAPFPPLVSKWRTIANSLEAQHGAANLAAEDYPIEERQFLLARIRTLRECADALERSWKRKKAKGRT